MKYVALLCALISAPAPALARDPVLSLPLDCTLGESCFIQNYVDTDPSAGAADFTCQGLSYDTHKGTDFALMDRAAMDAGVIVRPAAPGIIKALRDEMPDTGATPDLARNRYCGNGLVIDHGGGWETQYCHLKRGSLAVKLGQRVGLATALGEVGLSGYTQFPHLHITVRHDGKVIDPFNTDGITTCGLDDGFEDDLWAQPIPYRAGGIVSLGVASEVPAFEAIKTGNAHREMLAQEAPAIVGWAQIFGGRAGDIVDIRVIRPDGTDLIRAAPKLEKNQARLFRAAGKRRPDAGWQPGAWRVETRLIRQGKQLEESTIEFTVMP
ncbi:MAG: M23 family metallopeptidase [Maritimibacter sp.]